MVNNIYLIDHNNFSTLKENEFSPPWWTNFINSVRPDRQTGELPDIPEEERRKITKSVNKGDIMFTKGLMSDQELLRDISKSLTIEQQFSLAGLKQVHKNAFNRYFLNLERKNPTSRPLHKTFGMFRTPEIEREERMYKQKLKLWQNMVDVQLNYLKQIQETMSPLTTYMNDSVSPSQNGGMVIASDNNAYEFEFDDKGNAYSPYAIPNYDYYNGKSFIGNINDFKF